jgi:hypothetical protein
MEQNVMAAIRGMLTSRKVLCLAATTTVGMRQVIVRPVGGIP